MVINIECTNLEADLPELVRIDEKTTVKDKGWLRHVVIHGLPVKLEELLPLGRDDDSLLGLARLNRVVDNGDELLDYKCDMCQKQFLLTSCAKRLLCSRVQVGHASWRSCQICATSTLGS